jgi:uncharacterized protein (TIGR03437 family)
MVVLRTIIAAVLFTRIICAQPGLAQNGVVNAASRIPTTLAGGSIARGSLFTIEGVKFGSVANTTAVLKSGKMQVPVKILGSITTRVDAFMPESAPLGPASLVVSVDGKESRPFEVEISASNPGIFSRNGEGWGPGRIQQIAASGSRVDNSETNPAAPGATIAIAATGLGKLRVVEVLIGGAKVQGRATAKGRGEEEIVARIPRNAPEGCYVPVALMAGPDRASNFVIVAVSRERGRCDPGPLPQPGADRMGVVVMTRTKLRPIREGAPEYIRDGARALFVRQDRAAPPSPLRLAPPPGTCTAYTGGYESGHQGSLSISNFTDVPIEWWVPEILGASLDAGRRLVLRRGSQTRSLPVVQDGYYRDRLGEKRGTENVGRPLFLDPGPVQIGITGGRDVRTFSMTSTIPAEFEWTDREQTRSIDRAHGVTVHWKPGGPEQRMFLVASNVDQITTALGLCICALKPSEGQFTVPASLLANIPASQKISGVPYDEMEMVGLSVKQDLTAPGIDRAYFISTILVGRYVEYR